MVWIVTACRLAHNLRIAITVTFFFSQLVLVVVLALGDPEI
jgi:hypothetical protein